MKENIKLSFRLDSSDDTRMIYQRSNKYPGQVALMASFLPTFTDATNESSIQTIPGGQLEEQDLQKDLGGSYQYIFIADRSCSMGSNNRI